MKIYTHQWEQIQGGSIKKKVFKLWKIHIVTDISL